ncbi:MAG: type 1 glutamine amidotransferase domain-containing protein [Pseudomonadota bacterium]
MNRLTQIAAAAALATASLGASAKNVLVVLSDVATLELKDGKSAPTGFYLNELMQPVKLLLDAGHTLTFATPQGKAPTMDKGSANKQFFNNDEADLGAHLDLLGRLKLTAAEGSPVVSLARVEQLGYAHFDAVYVPGGHAPMEDLLQSAQLGKLLTNFNANAKLTALVCHGPIALLAALPDAAAFSQKLASTRHAKAGQKWIYAGYRMTVFSNKEEELSKGQLKGGAMKFYPQTALEQAGAAYDSNAPWQALVVTDRELITGQNPASALGVGKAMLARLK